MKISPIQLLVVDDDIVACARHHAYFEQQGYKVVVAHDGTQMWQALQNHTIGLVLLDVGLPGKDGLELARELRAKDRHLGIILVSARDDDIDIIVGLESGANDYVTKPFNSRELLARVKITLRATHLKRPKDSENLIRFGIWTLDILNRSLQNSNDRYEILPRGEMDLLIALARKPRSTLSRERLMHSVSQRAGDVTSRSIDVLVSRLRRKLEANPKDPQLILTVRNEGYILMAVTDQSET